MVIGKDSKFIRVRSVLANREYIKFFRKCSVLADKIFTNIGNVLAIRDGHYVY